MVGCSGVFAGRWTRERAGAGVRLYWIGRKQLGRAGGDTGIGNMVEGTTQIVVGMDSAGFDAEQGSPFPPAPRFP